MIREFIKYNLVGVINTLVGFGVIFTLMLFGLNPVVSNAIGYLVGSIVSFILNSKFTFKEKNPNRKLIVAFFLTLLLAYFLNYITLNYTLAHFNPYIAQVISGAVYTVSSFLIMKFFVFQNIKSFKKVYITLSLIIGALYYYQVKTTINLNIFNITITSNIPQEANFFIKTEYKNSTLICNKKRIKIDNNKKHDYFYGGEESIKILLKRGVNICYYKNIYNIKQKLTLKDIIILTILLILPISYILISLLNSILDRINPNISPPASIEEEKKVSKIAMVIILIGITLRVLYFKKFGVMLFQHDWQGHIDLIEYLAQNYSIPSIPNKGWEYPQQPLYYIITAIIYKLSGGNLIYIGYFSIFSSIIFLVYSYKLLRVLTTNRYVLYIALLFLTLTPSFIYMSARINNDVLVSALSVVSIYYIVKSYQNHFKKYFFTSLIFTTALFLTKISTATIELLFFGLLLLNRDYKYQRYIFATVGVILLTLTLWHLYHPLLEKFYFVNSAKFPNQTIENLNRDYFFSFNILELINQGCSYVFGDDRVRFSFPTYLFGTMVFGEFDYKYFISKSSYLTILMKAILAGAIVYIIGFIGYIIFIYKENLIQKALFGVFLVNLLLILKFLIQYPSVCNSDFRYFVGSWTIIGYIVAKGLVNLFFNKYIKYSILIVVGLLSTLEIIFILTILNYF